MGKKAACMGENLLDLLLENSTRLINGCDIAYMRYFLKEIDFSQKLVGVLGARGVGKTTAMFQYLRNLDLPFDKKLYISADMIEIADVSLFEIAKTFQQFGGEVLAIDEIHKNLDFEKELKNIYDRLDLKVVFSGSSALKLEHSKADLSRRAVVYRVKNLSFREFLELKLGRSFDVCPLEEIIRNHTRIAADLTREFRPFEFFKEYLQTGCYPFCFEDPKHYPIRLENTINTVIEVDLPSIFAMKYENIINLKKLVKLLCRSNPYELNISALSKKISIPRDKLYRYIHYLNLGSIFLSIYPKTKGDSIFTKPSKLYLYNPNLYHAYCPDAQRGTIRESFFANAFVDRYDIHFSKVGDFIVEDTYLFEIGGKSKSFRQIKDIPDSYIAADDIEVGFGNRIPLWLFGFLY